MKTKGYFPIASAGVVFLLILFWETSLSCLSALWLLTLALCYKKLSNHFISMLMTLEVFSLVGLLVSSGVASGGGSSSLIFILMSLSVGEGVLGLGVLVKFVRDCSVEQANGVIL